MFTAGDFSEGEDRRGEAPAGDPLPPAVGPHAPAGRPRIAIRGRIRPPSHRVPSENRSGCFAISADAREPAPPLYSRLVFPP